jgi:hypothetical protein
LARRYKADRHWTSQINLLANNPKEIEKAHQSEEKGLVDSAAVDGLSAKPAEGRHSIPNWGGEQEYEGKANFILQPSQVPLIRRQFHARPKRELEIEAEELQWGVFIESEIELGHNR